MKLVMTLLLAAGCTVGVADPPGDDNQQDPPTPQPTTPQLSSVAGGSFHPLGTYAGIAGRALMGRRLDNQTYVSVAISGLDINVMYTAHVHAASCRFQGGGHYKIDPAVLTADEANELWLHGTSSATGTLIADASFAHLTRGEALSIVVHDPASGAKMACADLLTDDDATLDFAGTLAPFAAATAEDMTVRGTLNAQRTEAGTSFTLTLSGLTTTALGYGTHVHALPCEVTTGGGHYKLDPLIPDTLEANEIWLPVTNYTAGTSTATVNATHVIRADAQSVVLHRTLPDATKPKIACANLTRTTAQLAFETSGTATALQTDNAVSGSAVMTRKLTGVTELAIVIAGLQANTAYKAHVHDQVCAAASGGGHFKFDRTVSDARADNEMWLELTSDAEGGAYDTMWVDKLAGADAASVVIHDGGGARVACFDLD